MHFRSALGIFLQQAMQKNTVDGVDGTVKRLG